MNSNYFDTFLRKLTPRAFCSLVWESMDDDCLSSRAEVAIFNALFASSHYGDDYTIYSCDDFDDMLDGLTPSQIVEAVAPNFELRDYFAINQSTGFYESYDNWTDLDVAQRYFATNWKQKLRTISDDEKEFRDLLDNILPVCAGELYEQAMRIVLQDCDDDTLPTTLPDDERLALTEKAIANHSYLYQYI